MQKRTLAVMTVVFVALLAYVLVIEVGRREEREEKEAREKQVLPIGEDDLRSIRLQGSHGPVALELGGEPPAGEWMLTEPRAMAADPAQAKALARAVATLEERRVLEGAGGDLATYGLDDPAIVIELTAEGLEPTTLSIGIENGAKDGRYLQIDDDPDLRIVPSYQVRALDKGFDDLRDRRLMRFSTGAVTSLTVHGVEEEVAMERVDGVWRLAGALPYRVDRRAVEDLLADLTSTRVTRFVDGDDPSLELQDPARWIALHLDDGEDLRVDIGRATENSVAVQVRGTAEAAEMDPFLLDAVDRTAADWRTMEVVDINPWQASRLVFDFGGRDIDISSDMDGNWTLTEGGDAPPLQIGADRAREILGQIDRLEGTRFLDPGADAGPQVGSFEITTEGQPVARFTLHRDGDRWAALAEGDPAPMDVPENLGAFLEEFIADPAGLP